LILFRTLVSAKNKATQFQPAMVLACCNLAILLLT